MPDTTPAPLSTWQEAERLARERSEHFFGDAAKNKSAADLFADMSDDASLCQLIFQVYCKDRPLHRETVPWFTQDPKDPMFQMRNIEKDRTNERANLQVQKKMVQSILKHGLNFGCRGEAWLVEPDTVGGPFTALSFGTLASAFYDAVSSLSGDELADNKGVQLALTTGLPRCAILSNKTPDSVRRWLRDWNNRFHQRDSTTLTDIFDFVEEADLAWQAQKQVTGLTARCKDYTQEMWKFVSVNS